MIEKDRSLSTNFIFFYRLGKWKAFYSVEVLLTRAEVLEKSVGEDCNMIILLDYEGVLFVSSINKQPPSVLRAPYRLLLHLLS